MEMRTIYKLHPGDTIYLVTPEGEIKNITLYQSHLDLAESINPNFSGAYHRGIGMLYEIKSKYNWEYHYQPDNICIVLGDSRLSSPESEIPLYQAYDSSDNMYSSVSVRKLGTEDRPVFAYATRELAQEQAKKNFALTIKNDIAKTIKFIVTNNRYNKPIDTFDNIKSWKNYTKAINKCTGATTTVVTENGRTFTKDEFEAYVNEQVDQKLGNKSCSRKEVIKDNTGNDSQQETKPWAWLLGDSDKEESPKSEQGEPKEKTVDQRVTDAMAEVKKRITEARKKLI